METPQGVKYFEKKSKVVKYRKGYATPCFHVSQEMPPINNFRKSISILCLLSQYLSFKIECRANQANHIALYCFALTE